MGLIVLLLLALISAGGYLYGVRLMVQPSTQHANAVARWDAAAIRDYRAVVRVLEPLRGDEVVELTVEEGTLTAVNVMRYGNYLYDADPPRFPDAPESAAAYTVEGLFTRAAQLTDSLPALYAYLPEQSHVAYHPEHGYVTTYTRNICGLLVSEPACITRYEMLDFQRLSD